MVAALLGRNLACERPERQGGDHRRQDGKAALRGQHDGLLDEVGRLARGAARDGKGVGIHTTILNHPR